MPAEFPYKESETLVPERFSLTRDWIMLFFYAIWMTAILIIGVSVWDFMSGNTSEPGAHTVTQVLGVSVAAVLLTLGIVVTVCLIDIRNAAAKQLELTARIHFTKINEMAGRTQETPVRFND